MAEILVVDDDDALGAMLTDKLGRIGHKAIAVMSLAEGIAKAAADSFDIILLDVHLPDGNGLEALPQFKNTPSSPEVIVITGLGNPEGAELAIKRGAWAYLEKPSIIQEILPVLIDALEYREGKKNAGKKSLVLDSSFIIGKSPAMQSCLDQMKKTVRTNISVLLTGETGVGKELFAQTIHKNSPRAARNFVVVDCAAFPETLVESMLFGHLKGAFTGADSSRTGLVKQADGGTLFLDEIGEMNLSIQKKFLRTLQEHEFRSVGDDHVQRSSFRLIAATNRDLDAMVRNGQFRADLLYRIQGFAIELPPLRKRVDDIKELTLYHLNRLSEKYAVPQKKFCPHFLESLMSYSWPGNVRELAQCLEAALANAFHEPMLHARHLPERIRIQVTRAAINGQDTPLEEENHVFPSTPHEELPVFREYRNHLLAQAEQDYLRNLMKLSRGSIKDACKISGLGRTRLHTLMKKHNVSRLGWSQ